MYTAPIVITPEELVRRYTEFQPFVLDCFHYLNGRINPDNPCLLKIEYYDAFNFAEFRRPNIISIKLASIINNLYGYPDETIKGLIMLSIAHELYHSNQSASMIIYAIDEKYREQVELHAEYYSQLFLKNNRDYIKSRFGIDVIPAIEHYGVPVMTDKILDFSFDLQNYYINTVVDLLMRSLKYIKPIKDAFMFDNVMFTFDDDTILIKDMGVILNRVREFNCILMKYRMPTMTSKYTISFRTSTVIKESTLDTIEIKFELKNKNCLPIVAPPIGLIN